MVRSVKTIEGDEMRDSNEYIKRYNQTAETLGMNFDIMYPNSARAWTGLAHDLRTLATLASEIASIQQQEDAAKMLDFEVEV